MSKKVRYGIVSIVTVMIIALAIMFLTRSDSNKDNSGTNLTQQEIVQQAIQNFTLDKQPVKGNRQAPIQIVEIGDYKCPVCRSWNQTVFPLLDEKYVQTGQAAFYYVGDAFLAPDSLTAAMASEYMAAQGDEVFWRFHELLLTNQGSKGEEWATVEFLTQLVETHMPDVDAAAFKQALERKDFEAQVKADMDISMHYQVQSVPAIFVNGQLVEGMDMKHIEAAIEAELSKIEAGK